MSVLPIVMRLEQRAEPNVMCVRICQASPGICWTTGSARAAAFGFRVPASMFHCVVRIARRAMPI
eukprot:11180681-Lingulodinium_polyedra.AAC.1